MITQDQSDSVAFLKDKRTHDGNTVEHFTTHISEVFLAGRRAFKLKRAVKLPYVDFSTPERRLETCQREIELNRRTAPGLYLSVRRITRTPENQLEFDGQGELVDAVVEMVRFETADLFQSMAEEGRITRSHLVEAADVIARFHNGLDPLFDKSGTELMEGVLAVNEIGLAQATHALDETAVQTTCAAFRNALSNLLERLNLRGREGRIVLGHGDLHLRNICLYEGHPTLFDCIEFNDEIATVDKMYDLAFLIMDIWHRDLPEFASLTANRYCDIVDDNDGFTILPFFMAVRAAVRAHTTATLIEESDSRDPKLVNRTQEYFDLARALLVPASPCLIAIGGLSGSGKTTVAENLAPCIGTPPGARILESDRIRKALFGVLPESRLPGTAYTTAMSELVYSRISLKADAALRSGTTVIADAVFFDREKRAAIEKVANEANVPFHGIWLDAPAEMLSERISSRAKGASDADLNVLNSQLVSIEAPLHWRHVDASLPVSEIADQIRAVAGCKMRQRQGEHSNNS